MLPEDTVAGSLADTFLLPFRRHSRAVHGWACARLSVGKVYVL